MTLGELQARLQEIANQSGNNINRQVLIADADGTLYQLDSVSLEGEVNLVFQLGEEADSTGEAPTDGETPAP